MQRNLEGDEEVTGRLGVKSLSSSVSSLRRSLSASSGDSRASSGASSNRKVSAGRKVRTSGWTKHLEDGVIHAATPLTGNLPKDLQALLSSKGALQCMEQFVRDLKIVPKHGTFKNGYKVEQLKPTAGEYVGKLEKLGINMFFCSFTDAKRMPHQWFEFVDQEINPTYMPHERVDLPRAVFLNLKMTLDDEGSEQEGLGRLPSTSASSNGETSDIPTSNDSTSSSFGMLNDVTTSFASTGFEPKVQDQRNGDYSIHIEEYTENVIDVHTQPPHTLFRNLKMGFGFCTASSTARVSVHTIASRKEPFVVADSGTIVDL